MADCTGLITAGISLNCDDINAAVGVDKDLHLYNYSDYKRAETLATTNIEADDTNGNIGGLTNIYIEAGITPFIFEGTDYSVQPTVSAEVKEDGNSWYIHSLLFTVYNKESVARNVIQELGDSKVIAVVVDRSSGLKEIFGSDQGLKLSALERAYVGTQTSNFYQVTLSTPDIAVVRESTIGLLAVNVENT